MAYGIVERKHRHLLNVARGLMFRSEIPLNMLSECILIVVYLINRLPSSILFGASPYLIAYGKEPNLSHIKCFGCLCYSIVLNNHDKFSSRPNDDERDSSNGKGNVMGSSNLNSPHPVIDEATFATHIDDNNNIFEGSQTKNNGFGSGIEFQNNKNNGDEPQTARKSNRLCVGVRIALRMENEIADLGVKENDFNQGINEYSLFVKNDNGIFLALLGYVDDIVVTSNNKEEIIKFKQFLASKFQIKDLDGYTTGLKCLFLGSQFLVLCVSVKFDLLEKVKKRATLSKSSVEAEHRFPLDCNNTSAIQIDANLVFHGKTKHYEIDVHLVREKAASEDEKGWERGGLQNLDKL
ncbi:ribonuclease H-like domain-containing protein [Tanacetum coccineum]